MDDPVTSDLIEVWAEGTLATWMTGHSDALPDGRQRRLVELQDDEYFLLRVEDYDGHHPDRVFRISIHVEEVK